MEAADDIISISIVSYNPFVRCCQGHNALTVIALTHKFMLHQPQSVPQAILLLKIKELISRQFLGL